MRASLLVLLTLGACAKERTLAPTEMVDLTRYLFRSFEDEDLVEEGMANLASWIDAHVDTDDAAEGYRLEPLGRRDTATVDHPERGFGGLLGAATAARSPHRTTRHAATMVLGEQTFANPSYYQEYDRYFEEGRAAFSEGSGVLRTRNEVTTKSFGVTIPYELVKDYRWVPDANGGPDHVLARSWVTRRSCGDSGKNCLELSFSVDVFQSTRAGCNRFTATWSEATTILTVPDDLLIAGLAQGMHAVYEHTDAFLDEGGV